MSYFVELVNRFKKHLLKRIQIKYKGNLKGKLDYLLKCILSILNLHSSTNIMLLQNYQNPNENVSLIVSL